ncbi:hypothetical protein C8R47DRAFT_424317 [Mycena vitilis]|nr:hypothetical protein C8R47DRAFT_424317 [Mycena vitilis]
MGSVSFLWIRFVRFSYFSSSSSLFPPCIRLDFFCARRCGVPALHPPLCVIPSTSSCPFHLPCPPARCVALLRSIPPVFTSQFSSASSCLAFPSLFFLYPASFSISQVGADLPTYSLRRRSRERARAHGSGHQLGPQARPDLEKARRDGESKERDGAEDKRTRTICRCTTYRDRAAYIL